MARFLSPDWVAAFNRVVGDALPDPTGDAGLLPRSGTFSMAQEVTGGPGGEIRAVLRVQDGSATLALVDGDDDADVTVRLSWDDAAALATGRLPAAEALAAGQIQLRGDLSVLAWSQSVLVAVSARLRDPGSDTADPASLGPWADPVGGPEPSDTSGSQR